VAPPEELAAATPLSYAQAPASRQCRTRTMCAGALKATAKDLRKVEFAPRAYSDGAPVFPLSGLRKGNAVMVILAQGVRKGTARASMAGAELQIETQTVRWKLFPNWNLNSRVLEMVQCARTEICWKQARSTCT
jgi:hypothetical protein